ncbi:unnamed protein product [Rotaria sp. Silwood1]|nr:unnamed protein product [Rotaria sp. Silwood1]CAF1266388.1 unnamed protein product [Rotaria sp. Silwood1]CAF3540650.1 unnamed protein product [Rotaria sp. Silwood1]CAF5002377.1 unnamed protein product [Rotaria sp. Silwood1]
MVEELEQKGFHISDGIGIREGTILGSIVAASGRSPTILGKPRASMFDSIRLAFLDVKPNRTITIGDSSMSNADTSTQQQSANDNKSVFTEAGRSKIALEVGQCGIGASNNSTNVENSCTNCNTAKCDYNDHKKTGSST